MTDTSAAAPGEHLPPVPGAYPPPPGYAPYGYLPPSGRKYWALLFLIYIPYVGVVVMVIVALAQRASAKQVPHPIMRDNARWAANWALSYALFFVVLMGGFAVTMVVASNSVHRDSIAAVGILPWLLLVAICIYCLVTIIRGTVLANRVVHRPALAIPFFRN